MAVSPNHDYLEKPCPLCSSGVMRENDNFSEWWVKCDECHNLQFCYKPMAHQLRFHMDKTKYKMYGGGFGSAKTSTCAAEFITLAMATPKGRGLVGAHTYPQLEQTAKKQILDMLPSELIHEYNKKDNIITLTNGYEIMFKSFDDEQKLRSLNLCHIWMEEANGTAFSVFTQLQTRLRHHATDDHRIIMSTNPDGNWVKTEVLMKADRIYGAKELYTRKIEDRDKNISVHIARTEMNTFLPPSYIEDLKVGKPKFWIDRYLNGSFQHAEGMVYPNFEKNIVHDITYEEIAYNIRNKGWQVIAGADFGTLDPTVLILAAIDPKEGVAYLYDEYVQNRLAVANHAAEMKRRMKHIPMGALIKMVGDPSGAKRSNTDQRSIFNHYAEHGIHFQKGNNRIDAGILKVYSYLEMGKLKILPNMVETIKEHMKYMYKATELGEKTSEIPVGGHDHTCDAVRYLINELPDDPMNLSSTAYGSVMDIQVAKETQAALPFELQTNEDELSDAVGDWYNYY